MSTVGQVSGSTATRIVYVAPLSEAGVQLSAIEIGTCADSLAGIADPAATTFTTSLTRRFGDPLPHVCVRGEVYVRGALAGESAELLLRVLGREERVETTRSFTLTLAGGATAFLADVPVDSLGPGTYQVEVAADYRGQKASAARELEIDASRIDIERNYEDYVELARYYLGDEAEVLRGVPPGERRARWDAFWKERDPDPATPENEKLEELIARVRVAADRFAERGGPGWGTDRGKVYIRYGEPDDVEQVPAGFNTPAYEIWRYAERNLTFVFADTGGFGEYVLVQPSSPF
jgi:GWxTD domain-containing protein